MTVNFEDATGQDFIDAVKEVKAEVYRCYCDLNDLIIELGYAGTDEERKNILASWTTGYKYIKLK